MENNQTYTAFAGDKLIISGDLRTMLLTTKECIDKGETDQILIFDDQTGEQIDFNLRGTPEEVIARLQSHPLFAESENQGNPKKNPFAGFAGFSAFSAFSAFSEFASKESQEKARTGPGRPKLGVVSHEVTLLPRHWDWLGQQPGGASVTLRKLVEEARKHGRGKELARNSWDAAGKFMWVMAGNLPDFEEASRALYAKDPSRLQSLISKWPKDIRKHLEKLVKESVRLEEKARIENQTQFGV